MWDDLFESAEKLESQEPALASILQKVIHDYADPGSSLACMLSLDFAGMMDYGTWYSILVDLTEESYNGYTFESVLWKDLEAILQYDRSYTSLIHAYIFHKGFKALQAYRLSHILYHNGRKDLAFAIQARICEVYSCNIHPSVNIGMSVIFDPLCNITIGEQVIIGSNCILNQGIRIMASKLQDNVIVGCNAVIINSMSIGNYVEIAPCSVTIDNVTTSTASNTQESSSSMKIQVATPTTTVRTSSPQVSLSSPLGTSTTRSSVSNLTTNNNFKSSNYSGSRQGSMANKMTPNGNTSTPRRVSVSSRSLLPTTIEVDKEQIRLELMRRKQNREKTEHTHREIQQRKSTFRSPYNEYDNPRPGQEYLHPKSNPDIEEKVLELKYKRDKEREEMKRMIAERKGSFFETSTNNNTNTDTDDPEHDQQEDEVAEFQDMEDDTLEMFYYYYDKYKEAMLESNGGSGMTKMPTKAELLNFVNGKLIPTSEEMRDAIYG